jgi:retron-type reverse transcriptase
VKKIFYPLNQSPLYLLSRERKLAELLRISPGQLRKLLKQGIEYTEWDIEKPNGKLRHIENPARPLKLAQAKIARLLGKIEPPEYLYCPVKGRSYVDNAARHRENRIVRCIDIKEYFPNSTEKRVLWFFKSIMKCEPDIAARLARLACFNGHLPTGSPLSPILAFYAHFDVWQEVALICKNHGLTLSIYIDDVTVSGMHVPNEVMWKIKTSIAKAQLIYHKEKHYIDQPAEVTGVILYSDGRLAIPHRQHKKLYDAQRFMSDALYSGNQEDILAIKGRIAGLRGQWHQMKVGALG